MIIGSPDVMRGQNSFHTLGEMGLSSDIHWGKSGKFLEPEAMLPSLKDLKLTHRAVSPILYL